MEKVVNWLDGLSDDEIALLMKVRDTSMASMPLSKEWRLILNMYNRLNKYDYKINHWVEDLKRQ